ncbi:MAG TPA: hypothetical protein VJT33_00760 [bacterium]|nr:hypothetical protein [bacterium]
MAEHVRGETLAQRAEDVIRRVRGVSAVRVDLAQGGVIDRVHVLSTAERSARVVAGDIVGALAAELSVEIEPNQIRVATQRSEQPDSAQPPARPRLNFVGMTVATLRASAEVKIQLEHDGAIVEGTAAGPNAAVQRLQLIGAATLRAVEAHLRSQGLFSLESVSIASLGARQVALALVAWLGPEGDVLSGSSVVRDDPREAVVRAVLNAVNRPVAWLSTR